MAVRAQGMAPAAAAAPVEAPAGTPKSLRVVSVQINPGVLALTGKKVTAAVPGVKLGDVVFASAPAGLALGVGIGNARVSAANTVEFSLTCTITLGVTLSAMTVSLLICET